MTARSLTKRGLGFLAVIVLCSPLMAVFAGPHAPLPLLGTDGCVRSGCHEQFAKKKVVHAPVTSETCDACHDVVDEKNHKFELTDDEPDICTECHDEIADDLEHEHGPLAAGQCTTCHDPHASAHGKLLVDAQGALCSRCHEALDKRIKLSSRKHQPATGDGCSSCHDPHGGDNRMFLKSAMPGLCTECHDEVGDLAEDADFPHAVMKDTRSCVLCHDAHASRHGGLLKRDAKAICLSCHDRPLKSKRGDLVGFAELLKKNPVHHAPIDQGECVSCHKAVHGGSIARLLGQAYPSRFYAPFSLDAYALCFSCHEAELVEEEEVEDETAFRNGEKNLHFVHVNKKAKGRACGACHDVHASKKPRLIAESVPFGRSGWRLPINFAKTGSGGSCQPGCHKRYAYDREKAVVNLPPPSSGPKPPAGPPSKPAR